MGPAFIMGAARIPGYIEKTLKTPLRLFGERNLWPIECVKDILQAYLARKSLPEDNERITRHGGCIIDASHTIPLKTFLFFSLQIYSRLNAFACWGRMFFFSRFRGKQIFC
jgi:hypothetical protein